MKNDLPTKIAIALLTTGFVLSASSWPILAYGLEDNFKDNDETYGNAIIQNDQNSDGSQFLDNNPVKSDSAISFDDDDADPSEFEKNEPTNNGKAIDYPGEVDDGQFINNCLEWGGSGAINFQAALYGPDPNFHTS